MPDTVFPTEPVRLLWFQGRPVSPLADGGAVTLDGAGSVVTFDRRLQPKRVALELEGGAPLSVSGASDGGFWVVAAGGRLVRAARDGRFVGAIPAPFDYPAAVADPRGGAWLVRSTAFFAYRLPTGNDPLLVYVDSAGASSRPVGHARRPEHILLAELANAGHVAVSEDAVFYAPFIRDEVVALSRDGDTLWVARRGLPQSVAEPRFEIAADGPTIDYAPVNLGIALGPGDRLYVLSVPGYTASEGRVDVFDRARGALLRSARLDTPLPTLAADREGRVYRLDPFRLLTGVAPAEREGFRPFELELMSGGRLRSDTLAGRVVLINFWASWCGPCREEMPALDALWRAIDHPDFRFLAMNEDVDVGDARAFIEEFGFGFPVLLGRGKLKAQYHYIGLPLTVLLDRDGRVVQRWIGFAGEEQLAGIRAVILAELERAGGPPAQGGEEHGGAAPGHGASAEHPGSGAGAHEGH